MDKQKNRAGRNKTINLSTEERDRFKAKLTFLTDKITVEQITNKTIKQDLFQVADYLPDSFVDLLFIDPPYNLDKTFF